MNKKLYWIIGASLCLLICGCGNSNINEEDQIKVKEQEDVLLGQWKKNVSDAIVLLTFEKNGRVIYDICTDYNKWYKETGKEMCSAEATLIGQYELQNNILKLKDFILDKNKPYHDIEELYDPSGKMIVDFDKMVICDRDEGIECSQPYKK